MQNLTYKLKVSRQTAMRWLYSAERMGVIRVSFNSNGKRGRPESVYHLNEEFAQRLGLDESGMDFLKDPEKILQIRQNFNDTATTKLDYCVDPIGPALAVGSSAVVQIITDTISKGVKMRYITEILPENVSHCKKMTELGVDVRHLNDVWENFAITDSEYQFVILSGRRIEQLLHSKSAHIVKLHQYLFDNLWQKAVPASERFMSLDGSGQSNETRQRYAIPFENIKALCKFHYSGKCVFDNSPEDVICDSSVCPFV